MTLSYGRETFSSEESILATHAIANTFSGTDRAH